MLYDIFYKMNLNFSQIITKSGAPLWTLTLPHSNSVAAGVLVFTGTRDEIWPKEAGIAHALEHMHFQGAKNFPTSKDISAYIEEIGGRISAWTSKEMTFYNARVPASYGRRAIQILGEQLNKSLFPEKKIETEMKNIIQEIKRRNDNLPRFASLISNQLVYKNHPLSKDALGLESSVLSFKKKDFLNFKDRYYNSGNYVFIAAGKITQDEALAIFNDYFPKEKNIKQNIRQAEKLIIEKGEKQIVNKDTEQLYIILSAAFSKAKDKDSLYLDFFRDMISGGMSFPLFQEIRDKRGLCYSINASLNKWSDVGKFNVYIGTDPKRHKEAIDATLKVIEKYKSDAELLDKVKNLKIGKLDLLYENTSDIINAATQDISFIGEPRDYEKIIKEIKEVNIGDIERAVDKYLNPELIFTTIIAPLKFKENI